MAFKSEKDSFYERRLRELDKQSRALRSDIRTIEKALTKPEELASMSKLKSARLPPPPSPSAKKDPASSAHVSQTQNTEAPPSGPQDLFSWEPRKSIKQGPGPQAHADGPGKSKMQVAGDERFANYFSSGSFIASKPLRGESNVQRNKAVFMLLLLVLVGIWVVSMISKYL